ncbi:MAG: carboxylating nicotinate-nucleotide diphosphorylase [bacterium]
MNKIDAVFSKTIQPIIDLALFEDIGTGDVTARSTIPADSTSKAHLLAKTSGVVAGLPVFEQVLKSVDNELVFTSLVCDGTAISKGMKLAEITGLTRSLLTAERTALNFLQRMSGIASATKVYVDAIAHTNAFIADTRKTAPGQRILDKYAVRMGAGSNHRFNLSDGVLIKDNHIAALGGVQKAVESARKVIPHTLKIEVEVTSIEMVNEALEAKADIIMLDNMNTEMMTKAVKIINHRALTEASGGVTLATVREIAECGVDLISIGAITHSVTAMDISLEIE